LPYNLDTRQKRSSSATFLGKSQNKTRKTYPDFTAKTGHQLALALLPEPAPILSFELVPSDLRLGADRLYIVVRQGDRAYKYPLQFRASEIEKLVPNIRKLDFHLDDRGVPKDLGRLNAIVELAIDGGQS
jgi:hypothetical protein